jgi:hypothetical protein
LVVGDFEFKPAQTGNFETLRIKAVITSHAVESLRNAKPLFFHHTQRHAGRVLRRVMDFIVRDYGL